MYIYLSISTSPLANLLLLTYCPRILYGCLCSVGGARRIRYTASKSISGNMDCKAAALGYTALFLGEFGGGAGEG